MLTLVFSSGISAADTPLSYADAKALWLKSRETVEYQRYAAEFVQFNNHFHLDEKHGCYAIGSGAVDLMLVITHPEDGEFAVIQRVLSNIDNAKARCFQKSYRGVQTKVPPFVPFVLQMGIG